jgi:CHAT domain-containing protein
MPISHAELITLTCPACGTSHTANLWLIVAPDERPDLVEQIRNGTLHTATCPQCGQTRTLDAPLLIFRPTAAPPILFSPAQQTSTKQDQELAAALIGILRQHLGAAWNDAWLGQGPAVVPRPMLLVALTDDPAAALQGLAARMQQALAELRRRDPEAFARLEAEAQQAMAALLAADQTPDEAPASAATTDAPALIQALDAFLNARTWTDSYREVQAHPELLSDEALALLEQRIATARTVGNSRAVAFFEEHLSLLRRCREVGAAAAFAEKIGVRVEELERRKAKGAVPAVFASWLATAQQAERRFLQTDDRNALATAVEAWRQILEHPAFQTAPLEFRCAVLNYAGGTFLRCYWAQGRAADLERALTFWTEALAATPPDSPDRPSILNNLGVGLSARYARSGRLDDLDAAIAAYEQALAATPPDSPDRPSRLTNLGVGLHARYARSGRLEELDAAIAAWQQALDTTPPGSPDRPSRLNNLGTGLSDRYARSGRLEDLDAAIAAYEQALAATPPDSPDRPSILNNLGGGLCARYDRSGRLDDLDAAIAAWQQALDTTPPDSPDRPSRLNNLGNGLHARYDRSGRLDDLDAAIAAWQQALDTTPPDSPDRPSRLNNLGTGLSDRYARSGRLEDLDAAIAAWQQALDTTPPDSPDRPSRLNNLGNGLRARYARSGRLEDLDAAIAAYEQALAATPPDSPDRPGYLNNLGTGLRARSARSGRLDDLKQARRSYALACKKGQLLAPDIALTASQSWGRWAGERHHWKEAAYAFGFGLETIEQLHRAQMRRSDQESWLSAARGLHTSAAYALVRAARPGALRRAVEVAELGRARGLGETLTRDRSDLSIIERDYPDIYERYRTAAEIVRSLERTDRASADRQDTAQLSFTDLANRIRAARADLDAAIEAIRAIPGYEAFLRPPAYPEIAAAAQPGVPLVYLITTPQGSLALIVPDGNAEPEALLLDGFTEDDLNNLLLVRTGDEVVGGYLSGQLLGGEALTTALETALPLLGEHLIAPVAQRLRTLNATGVTLIPTGRLSLLPLHAATYMVDGASRCLLDEFDVAYAPSARVLSIAQREQQRRAAKGVRLAGVGNPLPSDVTGDWALAELRRGLPNLRQQVQKVLPSLEAAAVRADPAMQKQIQDLLEIWRSTLKRLEELAKQTPEKVIKAGSDLARAAALFAALPADAGAFLSAIAARIPPSLTYARSELISILDLLPANAGAPLYEQQATREALWAVLSEATMAHFACHGQFGLDDTLDSALLLAQESRLTLRDLVAGDTTALSNLRLVVLSACQTAITDFGRLPDESIGLPGGFLQTGVPAVVGTLWSINDLISTALLIYRFYELHLRGDAAAGLTPQPPMRALRLAQQWLRDLTYKEMFAYFQWHRQLKGARMSNDLIEEGRALAEDYMLDHPNDRPYANPIFWAAFTFNGTIGGAA